VTELTTCPDCGAPAEVVDRYTLESTSGPVVHVATACAADRSHHYVQTLN
jgi:hypothetical protein